MVKIKKAGSQLLMPYYITDFTSQIKEGPLTSFKLGEIMIRYVLEK